MENLSTELRPVIEWSPPVTREDADQAILSLSNDIGLILAQLAEDQVDWCGRTGRSPADFAAWRRRALFAKVHKEGQLRECKSARARLSEQRSAMPPIGAREGYESPLVMLCRRVLTAWGGPPPDGAGRELDGCLAALAEYFGHDPEGPDSALLSGIRAPA